MPSLGIQAWRPIKKSIQNLKVAGCFVHADPAKDYFVSYDEYERLADQRWAEWGVKLSQGLLSNFQTAHFATSVVCKVGITWSCKLYRMLRNKSESCEKCELLKTPPSSEATIPTRVYQQHPLQPDQTGFPNLHTYNWDKMFAGFCQLSALSTLCVHFSGQFRGWHTRTSQTLIINYTY